MVEYIVAIHEPGGEWPKERPETFAIIEVIVTRIHAHEDVLIPDSDQIDTNQWQPLLHVFRHYFGTGKDPGPTFKALQLKTLKTPRGDFHRPSARVRLRRTN